MRNHIDTTQNPGKHTNIYVYRISIRRRHRQRIAKTLPQAFKKFVIAMKHADKCAAIRPVYLSDANKILSISASTQVQKPELLDISRYHQSWIPNQKWSLTGNMVIESSLTFQELQSVLKEWLNENNYSLLLSECQTSELVTIRIFNHSSYTLNLNELIANLKSMVADLPEDEFFEFSIRRDK